MRTHDRGPARPSAGAHYLIATAGYLALALLMLGPFLALWAAAIPGGPIAAVDGYQNVWNLWWVQRAVAAGQNPFVTDLLFYPQGAPLYLQTLSITNGLMALPVTALFGPVAAFNTAAVLSFALCGLAAYALTLRETGSRAAAALGGLIFSFGPFHVTKLWDGQLELVAAQWLPLFALFLLRAFGDGRRRDAVLAGVCLALVAYTSWYYALFAALFGALAALLWWPRREGRAATLRHLGQGALAAGVGAALVAPALVLAATAEHRALLPVPPAEVAERSANLLAFFAPSYLHPLWGDTVTRTIGLDWAFNTADWNIALGYTAIALAALGVAGAWRQAWRWLVILLAAMAFALGPTLWAGPWRVDLPMPYDLLAALPGLSLGRRPFLFAVVVTMSLAVLAGLGARVLLARLPARARPAALVAIGLLLAVEYIPRPWPANPAAVHPYYQTVARGEGAVLELPPPVSKRIAPQRAQLVHGRPLFGGYLARNPLYPFPDEAPVARDLWATGLGYRHDPGRVLLGPDDPLAALRAYGVRTVVVRWGELPAGAEGQVRPALERALPGVAPRFADGAISVYEVPAGPAEPLAFLAADWYPEERDGERRWRWMGAQGTIVLLNPGPSSAEVELMLRLESYAAPRELRLALDGAELGAWEVAPAPAGRALTLRLLVPPGRHALALRAPATREAGTPRELSLVLAGAEARWEGAGTR